MVSICTVAFRHWHGEKARILLNYAKCLLVLRTGKTQVKIEPLFLASQEKMK